MSGIVFCSSQPTREDIAQVYIRRLVISCFREVCYLVLNPLAAIRTISHESTCIAEINLVAIFDKIRLYIIRGGGYLNNVYTAAVKS